MGRKWPGVKAASKTSIEITFSYQGERCRERIKLKPTATNLRKAAYHRAAILDAVEKGTFDYTVTFPNSKNAARFAHIPGDTLTVGEYLSQWLQDKKPTLKSSTFRDYGKIINNQLIPEFGELRLPDLKRLHVRRWAATLNCTQKRIANLISPMRAALQDAVDDEILEANPLAGWSYKKQEPPRGEDHVDPFTREEQAVILDVLKGQGRNLIRFALWTGLRTSELVALEWNDIDWKKGVVRVIKAQTQAADAPETPKTKSGKREVKLLGPALAALTEQKAHTYLHSPRVFHNPRTGEPWTGDQAIRKTLWTPALKRAKVRYRNPYQTRHTYGSMMLSSGEPLAWVSDQMGHSSVLVTAKVYARWIPEADPTAGSRAEAMFASNANIKTTRSCK